MMGILCIKGGRVIDPEQALDEVRDLWVADEYVVPPGFTHPSPDEVIDATGMIVFPGFVDVHVHLREPGKEEAETIESGCAAALAGGFTSIVAMPNTTPPMDTRERIDAVLVKAKALEGPNVYVMPCATVGRAGEARADIASMLDFEYDTAMGIVGFTDDGAGIEDEALCREVLQLCAEDGTRPYAEHCEVGAMSAGGAMHPCSEQERLGLKPYPADAETAMIERDIRLAEETGAQVHFQHLSSARSVELIREAKARDVDVTAEVTPHHLALTAADAAEGGPNFKMNPPLRSEEDRRALIAGLKDGTIDMIATDHAPHTPESKAQPFADAPNGVIGMETAAAVVWTKLVAPGILSPMEMAERMSFAPKRAFINLHGNGVEPSFPCDAVIFDPNAKWTVDPEQFKSKGRNCPFAGWELTGRVLYTIVNGEVRYRADIR